MEDDDGQPYATTKRRDITLALGTGEPADVRLTPRGAGLDLRGRVGPAPGKGWHGFGTAAGTVGMLPLPLAALWDDRAVYRADVPQESFDHHFVAFSDAATPTSGRDVLALAKLRAIEHRIGVIILAGETREVIKTNRFKNIQRFQEERGLFGVDAEWLGGTRSAVAGYKVYGSWQGIPPHYVDAYLGLSGAEP